jgi:hypothetical protein
MARERRGHGGGLRPDADADRGAVMPAQPAAPPIADLQEMLRRATPVTGHEQPQLRATLRQGLAALCKAWAQYSLKRAIADVASTSEQDYRHFGFDKAEILEALARLQDEIGPGRRVVAERSHRRASGCPLAIVVSRARERRQSM